MFCLQNHRCEAILAIDDEEKQANHSPNNWLFRIISIHDSTRKKKKLDYILSCSQPSFYTHKFPNTH